MKTQYKIFISLFFLLLIGGTLLSPHLEAYFFPQDMAHREIRMESSTQSETENQLLWFEFEHDDLALYYQPVLADHFSEISYLDVNGQSHTAELDGFSLRNEMCGTYLVVSDPLLFDIDSDGTEDEIVVCAKADTNEMQGYSEYSNQFGELMPVPLEIVKNGRTGLILLQNGEAYTGEVTLYTSSGGQTMQVTDGTIDFVDARELWNGVVVTIRNGASLTIGTYVPEEHTIFTLQHLEACVPFFVLIVLIAAGIAVVCVIRKQHFRAYRNLA